MKKKFLKKIRGQAGESIAEALIAVLIIAASAVLLAAMITACKNIVTQSRETIDKYYEASSKLETFDGAEQGTVTIKGTSSSGEVFSVQVPVSFAKNNVFARNPIVAYRKTS